MLRAAALIGALLFSAGVLRAQETTGDPAVAERYFQYALAAAERGSWEEAEKTLDRALDFADASSDISYLLAVTRRRLSRPTPAALAAVRLSLATSRFTRYSREEAVLLEADCLVRMRAFEEAQTALAQLRGGADRQFLLLKAAVGLGDWTRFRELMRAAIETYPRDPRFLRFLFKNAGSGPGAAVDARLMDSAVKRVPFLIEADPELAVWAAPFIADIGERKRLLAAYRVAAPRPILASLPLALSLGLIAEDEAVEELFAAADIDLSTLRALHVALRTPQSRAAASSRAAAFSGRIADDGDGDEIPETVVEYRGGMPFSLAHDADQDGIMELMLEFSDGLPVGGRAAYGVDAADERAYVDLTWERYPFVLSALAGTAVYHFPPAGFPFAPVRLEPMLPLAPVLYPRIDMPSDRLTERSLLSFASALERPGSSAPDAVERIEYRAGVPLYSVETVGGITASLTEFHDGYPVYSRLDRDLDGKFDAVRRYRPMSFDVSSLELDDDLERSSR